MTCFPSLFLFDFETEPTVPFFISMLHYIVVRACGVRDDSSLGSNYMYRIRYSRVELLPGGQPLRTECSAPGAHLNLRFKDIETALAFL